MSFYFGTANACCFRGPCTPRKNESTRKCSSNFIEMKEKLPSAFEIPYTIVPTAGKWVSLQVGVADPKDQEEMLLSCTDVEEYACVSLQDASCCAKSP